MRIKTMTSLNTIVELDTYRTVKVQTTDNILQDAKGRDVFFGINETHGIYLAPEEARFLADLLHEAAGIVEKNREVNRPEPANPDPLTPSGELGTVSTAPYDFKDYKVWSASDVHGWGKNGAVRI